MASKNTPAEDEATPLMNDHHRINNDSKANIYQSNKKKNNGTFDFPGRPAKITITTTNTEDDDEDDDDRNNNSTNSNTEGVGLLRRLSSRNRNRQLQAQQQQLDARGHFIANDDNHHHRTDSSLMEVALESLQDISDIFVESLADVQEKLVEGLDEIQEVLEEPVAAPVKPREEGDHSQKLSAVAVAVLIFYKVAGGPYGCEPSVKAAGPFYTLLGFTIFPLIWCLPEALITAELGSAFPEPSGAVAWVEEAFGPTASLLCGFFHWVSGATDNAIYPSLFLKYMTSYLATSGSTGLAIVDTDNTDNSSSSGSMDLGDATTRFVFTVVITTILAYVNYRGLELVGKLSMVVCVISMSPFIVMCILAIPKLEYTRWLILPDATTDMGEDADDTGVGLLAVPTFAGVLWRPFLNSLFWNLNSFDVGASFAGEIQNPQIVFPRAMFLSIIFVVLGYLLPLLAALGATDTKQQDWDAGYFTIVAADIAGGPWLGVWLVFAAAISNIALFEAEMSGDAWQIMGMADRGLIPKVFGRRSRYGTPTNGIVLGTFVIFAVSVADFDQLVEMLNFAYSLSMIFEFSAFIKLRITDDDVDRPYRIPLNTFGCICFVTPPMVFLVYLMLIASKQTYLYLLLLILFGVAFYFLQKLSKHYNWADYVEAPKRVRRVKAGTPTANILSEESFDSVSSMPSTIM